MKTKIQWTDVTWNPVRGCSLVSPGCRLCYAMKQAHRFSGEGKAYEGLTELGPNGPRWNGKVHLAYDKLEEPLHWKKAAMVFVNSMSDLFHDNVPEEFILSCFTTMAKAHWHTYQVLTKRPERMAEVLLRWQRDGLTLREGHGVILPNVIVGTSIENQEYADRRIPYMIPLLDAGWKTMLSCEPLLGPIVFKDVPGFNRYDLSLHGLWVVVGGESGNGAAGCDVDWVRSIVSQCKSAFVAVFVKQLGANIITDGITSPGQHWPRETGLHDTGLGYWRKYLVDRKGGDMSEWPEDLRVREFLT